MKKPGKPPGGCIVCAYMKKHKNADFNRRIVEGVESIASIARDFGCATSTMERHAGKGKDKDGNPRQPHFAKDINVHNRLKTYAKKREAEAGLDLAKCQKVMWDKAQRAIDMALGDKPIPTNANLAVFGQCAGPAIKVIEVLAKVSPDKDDDTPGIDRAIAKMKEERDGK